jgi:hypothetical protein
MLITTFQPQNISVFVDYRRLENGVSKDELKCHLYEVC